MAELVQIHYPYVWDKKNQDNELVSWIQAPLYGGRDGNGNTDM